MKTAISNVLRYVAAVLNGAADRVDGGTTTATVKPMAGPISQRPR